MHELHEEGGLVGFNCKCSEIFCKSHRHLKENAWVFDFKSIGRAAFVKQNLLFKTDKLESRI